MRESNTISLKFHFFKSSLSREGAKSGEIIILIGSKEKEDLDNLVQGDEEQSQEEERLTDRGGQPLSGENSDTKCWRLIWLLILMPAQLYQLIYSWK